MIRLVIIDDEPEAIALLSGLLTALPDLEITGKATDIRQGLQLVLHEQPDLLLLDIDMPGGSGFELLDKIKDLGLHQAVIFITAFNEAVKAYDYAAFDYVMKPVDPERLFKAIIRFRNHQSEFNVSNPPLSFTSQTGTVWISPGQIMGCKADGNYTDVYLTDGRSETLVLQIGQLEKRLGPSFIRCHRSALINPVYLQKSDRRKMNVMVGKGSCQVVLPVSGGGMKRLNERI